METTIAPSQILCVRGSGKSSTELRFELPVLQRGHLYHVQGRSGTGKSTLLSCIAGMLPFAGTITVFGKTISGNAQSTGTPELYQLSSALLQRHVVDPDLTVRSHATFVNSKRDFDSYLAEFDLLSMNKKKANNMSMGQQQRLGLAVVLAQHRDLIILDEPTAHQDIQYTRSIGSIISRMIHEGKTIVFSSHDRELLQSLDCPVHQFNNVVKPA